MKKYKLLEDDKIVVNNVVLSRIVSLREFGNVKAGDLGGYIEGEHNLSHDGNCWVFNNAKVFNNACVEGGAVVALSLIHI